MALHRCRLSKRQQNKLIEFFVAGIPARSAASIVGVHRNSAAYFFHRIRQLIAHKFVPESSLGLGDEIPKRYFLLRTNSFTKHNHNKKTPLFGIWQQREKIYIRMIQCIDLNTYLPTLQQIQRPDGIVYFDKQRGDGRIHVSGLSYRTEGSKSSQNTEEKTEKLIETFWIQAKRHLRRYHGIPKQHFHLFIQECAWRFNGGSSQNQIKQLKRYLKQ